MASDGKIAEVITMGKQQTESLEEPARKAKQLLQVQPQSSLANLVHLARRTEIQIIPIKGIVDYLDVSDLFTYHRRAMDGRWEGGDE